MARIVYGSRGAAWRAPEWIVRNFCGAVCSVLERMSGCASVARQLADVLASDAAVIDLTLMLDDPQLRAAWLHALDAALLLLNGERPEDWHEPQAYAPFFGSVRRFIDGEHARTASVPASVGSADPADVLVGSLPWVLDDGLDR